MPRPRGSRNKVYNPSPQPDLESDVLAMEPADQPNGDEVMVEHTHQEPQAVHVVVEPDAATMAAATNGLKPCPVCKSTDIHQTYLEREHREYVKYCDHCGFIGPRSTVGYADAEKLWNDQ